MRACKRAVDWRVHVALIFVQLAFGSFTVFGKYVLGYFEPLAVAAIRALGAAPVLFLIGWRITPRLPSRGDLFRLALLGLLGACFNQLLYITGLNYTTATSAAILMPSIPVFAAMLAGLLGIERMAWKKWVGVVFAVTGALIMLGMAGLGLSRTALMGNALVLLNCASFALYLVLQRPLLERLHPMTVLGWAFLFGGLAVLAAGLPSLLSTRFASIPAGAWWGVAYIVLIPTIVNYSINIWAVRRSSPTLVAAYTTLQPVSASALAVLFLQETVGLREVLGFVLIVAGLVRVSTARER